MELCGRLVSVNAYGDWSRGMLETGRGERVPVVGRGLNGLEEAENYRLRGEFVVHPKYGRQFDVEDALVDAPAEAAGVLKFVQKHFKGCGEKTAGGILDWYVAHGGGLQKLREDLVSRPWMLEKCPALGARKIEYMDASGAGVEVHVTRRISAELADARLPEALIKKIVLWLLKSGGEHAKDPVEWCWARLKTDPFYPAMEVDGYTLRYADRVAAAVGMGDEHEARTAFATHSSILEGMRKGGHVWLNMGQARRALMEAGCRGSVEQCAAIAKRRGYPVEVADDRVYTTVSLRVENFVSERLGKMLIPGTPIWTRPIEDLTAAIERLEAAKGESFRLDDSQRGALIGMLTSEVRVHVLTSWPGCGKTTFLEMLSGLVRDTVFAAPYSKAAKVLNARIAKHGAAASTVHMLLEATGEGFRRNRGNQLVARTVVVDETGTVDLFIFSSILEAMSPWAHLVVVGDVDQLESVGQGRVLQDMVELKKADQHRLTTTHRNKGAILDLVGMVREGSWPKESPGDEVVFIGADAGSKVSFDHVVDLWLECVGRHGFEAVGLLFGHRVGSKEVEGWNVTFANSHIQRMVNSPSESNRIPGCELRVADRVIVRKAMTLKRLNGDGEEEIVGQLANGDMGFIVGVNVDKRGMVESLKLKLDEGRTVDYPGNALGKLDLAYAMTVHSAQGSEFDEVILVVPDGPTGFLNRNLLLTGASRAKERLWVVGKQQQLARVAAKQRATRNSSVADKVNNQGK
jgi:exodeoxyribonuclease V alpha subunit